MPYGVSPHRAATSTKYDIVADGQSTGTVGIFDSADYIASPGYQGFTVNPQVAAKLTFTIQPIGSTAGSSLTTQPVVTVQDVHGNTVTGSNVAVTVAITSGSGASGATLFGTKTVNAANGVAAFSDLNINLAGSAYTLTATSPGLVNAVSSAFNIAAVTGNSGGGGGGGSSSINQPVSGTTQATWTPSLDGVTSASITVTSQDGVGTVTIPQNTLALDSQKKPLSNLSCVPVTTPAATPADRKILVQYEMGPSGATFSPPITITLKYDPISLPQGTNPNTLILAYYDTASNIWTPLNNVAVNNLNHTLSGRASHFTEFGILLPTITTTIPVSSTPAASPTESPVDTSIATATAPVVESPVVTSDHSPAVSPSSTVTAPVETTPASPPAAANHWPLIIGIIGAVIVIVVLILIITRKK